MTVKAIYTTSYLQTVVSIEYTVIQILKIFENHNTMGLVGQLKYDRVCWSIGVCWLKGFSCLRLD